MQRAAVRDLAGRASGLAVLAARAVPCERSTLVGGEPMSAGLEHDRRLRRAGVQLAYLPAVAMPLADAGWRIASRVARFVPVRGYVSHPAELYPPWWPAAITLALTAWLLLRPGRIAAIVFSAVELLRALGIALPLALVAWERFHGWGIYMPDGAPQDGWTFYAPQEFHSGPEIQAWQTELVHLALNLIAVALVPWCARRLRRAREEARRAEVIAAF